MSQPEPSAFEQGVQTQAMVVHAGEYYMEETCL